MFEKIIPASREETGTRLGGLDGEELLIGNVDSVPVRGGALRALEWNEVTARLNAARDLRLLMRRDARLNIHGSAASFGDAAATYFRAAEYDERIVNHDALGHCKASRCIGDEPIGDAATGDARE
ncbi:hypothetical protein [Erythrobacter sp. THAF29]|uniref:hypothetical protein n=1 Tax=Erythrobacter sp. THAF29 TaxID=2587851 RepID=UPI00126911EB|nr:hypothetical protein [Erythrobacter sp. THAF29]QFT76292.1 hypothetical protein FIU90_01930 [Erythrobacter sp. THAF29]